MEKRDFNEWFSNFTDTIATWKYYTDFDKVYRNTNGIKDELNLVAAVNMKKAETLKTNNDESTFKTVKYKSIKLDYLFK